jgi:hypothetical protein
LVTMVALVKPRFDCFSNLIGLIYSSSLGNGKPCCMPAAPAADALQEYR